MAGRRRKINKYNSKEFEQVKQDIVIKSEYFVPGSKDYNFYNRSESTNGESNTAGMILSAIEYIKSHGAPDEKYANFVNYASRATATKSTDKQHWWTNQHNDVLKPVDKNAIVWSLLISFSDSYQKEHGIFDIDSLKPHIELSIQKFFRKNNLDPENMQYIAGVHTNTDNVHIHFRINEINPVHQYSKDEPAKFREEGHFTQESFKMWKHHINKDIKDISMSFNKTEDFQKELVKKHMENIGRVKMIELVQLANEVREIVNKNKNIDGGTGRARIAWNTLPKGLQDLVKAKFNDFIQMDINLINTYNSYNEEYEKTSKEYFDELGYVDDEVIEKKKIYDGHIMNGFINTMKSIWTSTENINDRSKSGEKLLKIIKEDFEYEFEDKDKKKTGSNSTQSNAGSNISIEKKERIPKHQVAREYQRRVEDWYKNDKPIKEKRFKSKRRYLYERSIPKQVDKQYEKEGILESLIRLSNSIDLSHINLIKDLNAITRRIDQKMKEKEWEEREVNNG